MEVGDGDVGHRFEGVSERSFDRVRFAGELDLDRLARGPVEADDQVGQFVARGAQVDVAAQLIVEQRRRRRGGAVDRSLRTLVGCELDPGADLADVGVVEERRFRQLDLGVGDVGVARSGNQCRREARVRTTADFAFQRQFQIRFEAEVLAATDLEGVGGLAMAPSVLSDRWPLTDVAVQSVGFRVKSRGRARR